MVRHVPVYFGTVVADKKDLRKVKAPYRKVGEWEWLRGDLLD